jgi:hypothetical protein
MVAPSLTAWSRTYAPLMFPKGTSALMGGLLAGGEGVYVAVKNETTHSVRCIISESTVEDRGLASSGSESQSTVTARDVRRTSNESASRSRADLSRNS